MRNNPRQKKQQRSLRQFANSSSIDLCTLTTQDNNDDPNICSITKQIPAFASLFPDPERTTAGSVPTNLKKIHHHHASARELFTRTMMHKTTDVIDMPAPSQRAEDTHNKAIIDPRLRLSFLRINDTRELIRCFKTSESSNPRHVQNALRARIHFIGRPSAISEYDRAPSEALFESHSLLYCYAAAPHFFQERHQAFVRASHESDLTTRDQDSDGRRRSRRDAIARAVLITAAQPRAAGQRNGASHDFICYAAFAIR